VDGRPRRAVRAIRQLVRAARELTDAERALKRPHKKARREQTSPNTDGTEHGQGADGVRHV
jgi:hypothetical protein